MFLYYTVTYFPGIFYAVVRQISMLFTDNKDSILFCVHAPVDGTGIQCLCSQGPGLLPPALPWPGRLPRSCPEHCQTEASLQCYQECCCPQHPHHQHFWQCQAAVTVKSSSFQKSHAYSDLGLYDTCIMNHNNWLPPKRFTMSTRGFTMSTRGQWKDNCMEVHQLTVHQLVYINPHQFMLNFTISASFSGVPF